MARPRFLQAVHWTRASFWLAVLLSCFSLGCHKSGGGTSDPEAKLRLWRLGECYLQYTDQKSKGPPNEQAFKDFIRQIPKAQRDRIKIGDDIDGLFVSPRDGEKYVIKYNLAVARGGDTIPIAWEQTGKNGKRWVALSMGYVEEYGEAALMKLQKKPSSPG